MSFQCLYLFSSAKSYDSNEGIEILKQTNIPHYNFLSHRHVNDEPVGCFWPMNLCPECSDTTVVGAKTPRLLPKWYVALF